MSKKLTPLEALEKIVDTYCIDNMDTEIDIIETALKRLEKIETTTHSVLRDDISKKLKAFEIVAEKDVDGGWLRRAKDLHEYNSGMGINSYSALTQEEYDLLKEILK